MIGVGITTYQRFDRFKESFESLLRNCRDVEEIVIVDDASIKDKEKYDEYFANILFKNIKIIRNEQNRGVGYCKNRILKYLYDKGYDYIFTLEDDINIINPDVFQAYVDAHLKTGFHYFNFAFHGDGNKGYPVKKEFNDYELWIHPNCVGAFTFYTKELIADIGYHDEKFLNAWEHVEYCYRASKKGYTTPFWQFIDIPESFKYLVEQKNAITDSSIRPRSDWNKNIEIGLNYFREKHGVSLFGIPRS